MARYSFLTTWALGAPAEIGRVFDALHDSVAYPTWWKGVQAVERLMEGEASGELEGTGRWRLWENPAGVCVTYEWNVGTTAPWMNLLASIAKPVFAWNHDYVMRNGGEGLARLVGAPLLVSD